MKLQSNSTTKKNSSFLIKKFHNFFPGSLSILNYCFLMFHLNNLSWFFFHESFSIRDRFHIQLHAWYNDQRWARYNLKVPRYRYSVLVENSTAVSVPVLFSKSTAVPVRYSVRYFLTYKLQDLEWWIFFVTVIEIILHRNSPLVYCKNMGLLYFSFLLAIFVHFLFAIFSFMD